MVFGYKFAGLTKIKIPLSNPITPKILIIQGWLLAEAATTKRMPPMKGMVARILGGIFERNVSAVILVSVVYKMAQDPNAIHVALMRYKNQVIFFSFQIVLIHFLI